MVLQEWIYLLNEDWWFLIIGLSTNITITNIITNIEGCQSLLSEMNALKWESASTNDHQKMITDDRSAKCVHHQILTNPNLVSLAFTRIKSVRVEGPLV